MRGYEKSASSITTMTQMCANIQKTAEMMAETQRQNQQFMSASMSGSAVQQPAAGTQQGGGMLQPNMGAPQPGGQDNAGFQRWVLFIQ